VGRLEAKAAAEGGATIGTDPARTCGDVENSGDVSKGIPSWTWELQCDVAALAGADGAVYHECGCPSLDHVWVDCLSLPSTHLRSAPPIAATESSAQPPACPDSCRVMAPPGGGGAPAPRNATALPVAVDSACTHAASDDCCKATGRGLTLPETSDTNLCRHAGADSILNILDCLFWVSDSGSLLPPSTCVSMTADKPGCSGGGVGAD
jgi:hypothetical protein